MCRVTRYFTLSLGLVVKVGSLMSCWTQDEVSQAFCRNALFAMSWCGRQILSCWTWWKRLSLIDSYCFSTAKLLERLENPAPGMAQLAQVQRILRWLFADADSDFDSQLSHQELKAGFLLHEKTAKQKASKTHFCTRQSSNERRNHSGQALEWRSDP